MPTKADERADIKFCEWWGICSSLFAFLQEAIYSGCLTHLCQMEFPVLILWMNLLRIYEMLGGRFQFHSNFKSTFCKQTVQNLIRRCIMQRLI